MTVTGEITEADVKWAKGIMRKAVDGRRKPDLTLNVAGALRVLEGWYGARGWNYRKDGR